MYGAKRWRALMIEQVLSKWTKADVRHTVSLTLILTSLAVHHEITRRMIADYARELICLTN